MKIEKEIKVPCFGGGFNTYIQTITDEYKGIKLGLAISVGAQIEEDRTDHIESEDEDTITFDFGTVRKDKIQALVWESDAFGIKSVRRVRYSL